MTHRPVPSVSVVIPVWDRYCHLLRECVESVESQEAVSAKVIVVDNASDTALPALPERTAVVRLASRVSVGTARNAGLGQVQTPYVTFLDADDVLLPGALSALASRLGTDAGSVTACGRFVTWNSETDERRLVRRAPKPSAVALSRYRRLFALANLAYNSFPVVGCVHRADAVRQAGGFADADVAEDWVLGAMLCWYGHIRLVDQPTFLRRVHEGSLWYRRHDPQHLLSAAALLRQRARHDDRVPGWAKSVLPGLARLHRRSLRRAVEQGALTPEPLLTPEPSA